MCDKCHRKKCKFYNEIMENNCLILNSVYKNNKECKFFKKKDNEEER